MVNPIAIKNFLGLNINIYWYGIIICTAILLGIWVASRLAKKRGYYYEMIVDYMIWALPISIICARLYYVAFEWEIYAANPISMLYVWEGGLAIYGGIIGAVATLIVFCKMKKIPLGDLADCGAPALALGQAIGRWGNFVNQEAYGNPVTNTGLQWFPYAVYIENEKAWFQATFFYESVWNLLVFGTLLWYFKRAKHKGNVFALYFALYGAGRFFIEGLRSDSLWVTPTIRVSQLLSALLCVAAVIYLLIKARKEPKLTEYEGQYTLAAGLKREKEEKARHAAKKAGVPYIPEEDKPTESEESEEKTKAEAAPDEEETKHVEAQERENIEVEDEAAMDEKTEQVSETEDPQDADKEAPTEANSDMQKQAKAGEESDRA